MLRSLSDIPPLPAYQAFLCGSRAKNYRAINGASNRGRKVDESLACVTTSFPGSLFSASLGRSKKEPGCGWSHDHPESGWQKNLLVGRGSRVLCLVDVKNVVGFKSSSSR